MVAYPREGNLYSGSLLLLDYIEDIDAQKREAGENNSED